KVTELIDRANEAGGADNITVLLIEYKEDSV
ncbi:MAG: protein-serine/threonine phosphatase, partial [Bacillus sp. (in: Bacteria)]|nr:protein-serine/threonine phosphatase [Bacillus sp. (in: firmicutes)]